MCSICRPILHNLALPHDSDTCPLKKSLWCEFCSSRGHTQWTCHNRLQREKQLHYTRFDVTYKHPDSGNLYDKPIYYLPKTDKGCRALLKGLGEKYTTDAEKTKQKLRKKLESLNYQIIE